uniref:SphA family protein n=1 Tax=Arhodomonas aquaeolei TaxID=2369 RepID=UPI000382CB0C
ASADATQHYVPGVEGSLGASVPPPGFYLRTYGVYYDSDNVKVDAISDNDGEIPGGDDSATVRAVVPRAIWITDKQFLGADYGMEAIAPILDKDVDAMGLSESDSGLGDVFLSPLILAWHGERYDTVLAAGYWTDAFSDYDDDNPVAAAASVGQGYSNVMVTLGGTWYLTADRTWAVSLLNRYETMASEVEGSNITPGDNLVAEWGVSYDVNPALTLGLVGYDSWQLTEDDAPAGVPTPEDEVHAIGGQLTYRSKSLGMAFDAALYDEYDSKHRPEGTTARVIVTIPF